MKDPIRFMREACYRCDRSECEVKTGAVAVRGGEVIIDGWNELNPELLATSLPERERTIHAEASLIEKANKASISLEGCLLFVTRFPCEKCADLIYKSGIRQIYYMSDLFTTGNTALPLFSKTAIQISQIKEEDVWK